MNTGSFLTKQGTTAGWRNTLSRRGPGVYTVTFRVSPLTNIPIWWTKWTHSCTNYSFTQNNSSCPPASKMRTPLFSSSADCSKNYSELTFINTQN